MSARNIPRRIGASIAAALAGIAVGIFMTGLLIALHTANPGDMPRVEGEAGLGMLYRALFIPAFMLPVWLFFLLPLCLVLLASARLSRPAFVSALGSLAAVVAVAIVMALPGAHQTLAFYVLAAVVGAVSCYTGAALIRSSDSVKDT